MTIRLDVDVDADVATASMDWMRARDRHDDACARRDALAHRVLVHMNANECLDWLTPETSALLKDWLSYTLDAAIALDTRRDALSTYTRSIDALAESIHPDLREQDRIRAERWSAR